MPKGEPVKRKGKGKKKEDKVGDAKKDIPSETPDSKVEEAKELSAEEKKEDVVDSVNSEKKVTDAKDDPKDDNEKEAVGGSEVSEEKEEKVTGAVNEEKPNSEEETSSTHETTVDNAQEDEKKDVSEDKKEEEGSDHKEETFENKEESSEKIEEKPSDEKESEDVKQGEPSTEVEEGKDVSDTAEKQEISEGETVSEEKEDKIVEGETVSEEKEDKTVERETADEKEEDKIVEEEVVDDKGDDKKSDSVEVDETVEKNEKEVVDVDKSSDEKVEEETMETHEEDTATETKEKVENVLEESKGEVDDQSAEVEGKTTEDIVVEEGDEIKPLDEGGEKEEEKPSDEKDMEDEGKEPDDDAHVEEVDTKPSDIDENMEKSEVEDTEEKKHVDVEDNVDDRGKNVDVSTDKSMEDETGADSERLEKSQNDILVSIPHLEVPPNDYMSKDEIQSDDTYDEGDEFPDVRLKEMTEFWYSIDMAEDPMSTGQFEYPLGASSPTRMKSGGPPKISFFDQGSNIWNSPRRAQNAEQNIEQQSWLQNESSMYSLPREGQLDEVGRSGVYGELYVSPVQKESQVAAEPEPQDPQEILLQTLRSATVGDSYEEDTVFGRRRVLNLNALILGKPLVFIEDFVRQNVVPLFTSQFSSFRGKSSSESGHSAENPHVRTYRDDARAVVKKCFHTDADDMVFFVGSTSRDGVQKLIDLLHLRSPVGRRGEVVPSLTEGEFARRPVVFVNTEEMKLAWTNSLVEVVMINQSDTSSVDIGHLDVELRGMSDRPLKIGCFSVVSSATGVGADVARVSAILHRQHALAVWDFSVAAAHCPILMNFARSSVAMSGITYCDAVVMHAHHLPGGTGTTGMLVAKKRLFHQSKRGGSEFVDLLQYLQQIEMMEEGTPAHIISAVRTGLVMQLRDSLDISFVRNREVDYCRRAMETFKQEQNIFIFGAPAVLLEDEVVVDDAAGKKAGGRRRVREQVSDGEEGKQTYFHLPVLNFNIVAPSEGKHASGEGLRRGKRGVYLHHMFVVALLKDLFGIRAGGIYADSQALGFLRHLAKSSGGLPDLAEVLDTGDEYLHPGWVSLLFDFTLNEEVFKKVVQAVVFIARNGHSFLPFYEFDKYIGEWKHRSARSFRETSSVVRLEEISYSDGRFECGKRVEQESRGGSRHTVVVPHSSEVPTQEKALRKYTSEAEGFAKMCIEELTDDTLSAFFLEDPEYMQPDSSTFMWYLTPRQACELLVPGRLRQLELQRANARKARRAGARGRHVGGGRQYRSEVSRQPAAAPRVSKRQAERPAAKNTRKPVRKIPTVSPPRRERKKDNVSRTVLPESSDRSDLDMVREFRAPDASRRPKPGGYADQMLRKSHGL